MDEISAIESLTNAIYNLEKNYGKMPGQEANRLMLEMALSQMKYALKEMCDDDYAERLESLGLVVPKEEID